jgi:leucyl/phenylalanyl-tRNA--protein transferase
LWWSPNPRAVLFPDDIHVSRSLAKAMRRETYEIRVDSAFRAVIEACAAPRGDNPGTWILPEMLEAYTLLHQQGHAHSIECWLNGNLAGGLYGVAINGVFCGESMFSRADNASKIALVHLARGLSAAGFSLIDCQVTTPHVIAMGATTLPRGQFIEHLRRPLTSPPMWPTALISARIR